MTAVAHNNDSGLSIGLVKGWLWCVNSFKCQLNLNLGYC